MEWAVTQDYLQAHIIFYVLVIGFLVNENNRFTLERVDLCCMFSNQSTLVTT